MRCWYCRGALRARFVDRDGLIRGRDAAKGGPYRLYRCPRCLRENKVEQNRAGRRFASPPKEISLFDYLFGWIEPLAPEDYLRILEWQEESGPARRAFFESGGDRRYSGGIVGRVVRRILGKGRPPAEEKAKEKPAKKKEGEKATPKEKAPRPIPHPYRVLGVSPDASDEEIRSAFRDLARRWHPDKQRDPEQIEEATRRWQQLMRAFESIQKHRS